MHEMAVCLSLLRQVEEVARSHGARSVEKIFVTVGPLSGVEPQLLEGAFSIARTGTIAGTADLVFDPGKIAVCCRNCGRESAGSLTSLVCAHCQSRDTRVTAGRELILKRVELSFPEDNTGAA